MTRSEVYRKVRTALKQGILVRPESCSRCRMAGKASDGRALIHAHHHDYSRPLDIEWICAKCHRKYTPLPKVMGAPCYGDANGMRKHDGLSRGSKNGFSKLTEDEVSKIKAMQGVPVKEIASTFNVKPATIYDILSGRNWKHVAAAPKQGD